jgi:hypothetical protein
MGEKAVTGAVQPMTTWTIWKISDKRNLAAFQESEIIRKAKSKQNQSKIPTGFQNPSGFYAQTKVVLLKASD